MCVQRRAAPAVPFNPRPLVLVVEPDAARRRVLADGLASIGCDSLCSTDAVSALANLAPGRTPLDLLILGEQPAQASAMDTIERVRKLAPCVSVIAVTDTAAALPPGELPPNVVRLRSPVSLTALVRALHELMRERAAGIADF